MKSKAKSNKKSKFIYKWSAGKPTKELTAELIGEILDRYCEGVTQVKLAKEFGVSQSRISKALKGTVEPNRFAFDPDGNPRIPTANELLRNALKNTIRQKLSAEKKLKEIDKQDNLKAKLEEKTKELKLVRNENNRLRKRNNRLTSESKKSKKR